MYVYSLLFIHSFISEFLPHALHFLLAALHFFQASVESRHFPVRISLVLFVFCLQLSQKLLFVCCLAQDKHQGGREEERDEIVEVKASRVVIEHEEEHQRHEIHHPLHHLHLFSLLSHHLVFLLLHGKPRVDNVCHAEQYTCQRQMVAYQPQVCVPFDNRVVG